MIIDISQPIRNTSAVFPGDTPFKKTSNTFFNEACRINLTAFTMSPHVGTHADAPLHIKGALDADAAMAIGVQPLTPFVGEALVVDVSHWTQAITPEQVEPKLSKLAKLPPRVVFKTQTAIRYDVFEREYAYFSPALVDWLHHHGVVLMGLDTPSVDHIRSKTLETHYALLERGMVWLENLDLTEVTHPGPYTLVALPLKFEELEASPVRAILLDPPQL